MSIFSKIKKSFKKEDNYRFRLFYKEEFIKFVLENNEKEVLINSFEDKLYKYLLETDIFEISEDKSYLKLYYDSIYLLDENDFEFFNLPEYFTGYINIDTEGHFQGKNGIKYNYEITDSIKNYYIRFGNIIESGNIKKILPKEQYKLIKEINLYNNGENTKLAFEQYKIIHEINKKKDFVDIIMSGYLKKSNDLEIIDNIVIDFIENENGEIELIPKIESFSEEDNKKLEKQFKNARIGKSYYEIEINNKKLKIVINETIKKTINTIKKYDGKISKSEFINRSSNFFEEEILESENISLNYGPRVKGLGYLSYRPSPAPNNSDIDWFNKELPRIYTDENSIKLEPQNLSYLEQQLEKIKGSNNKIELEFNVDNEKKIISLNEENLSNEIKKLKNSMKDIMDYKRSKQVNEIIDLMKDSKNKEYVEYNGNYIKFVASETQWVKKYLISLVDKEEKGDKKKKRKEKVLLLEDNINQIDYSEANKENKEDNFKLIIPKSLRKEIKLLEHQEEGVKKLEFLYSESKVNGILLADDMGLGKTIQILVFLAYLKEINELLPSLIVLPTSLIDNWKDEIEKFFESNTFKLKSIKGRVNKALVDDFLNYDLILTSYETLRINHVKMGKIKWSAMVCDEAQKIKNPSTLVTTAVKTQNVKFKIVSTATPIENNLQDLWCLVDLAKPGLLYSLKEFKKRYLSKKVQTKEKSFFREEKKQNLNDELQNKLGNSFIRRMKEDALNKQGRTFPKKIIKYIEIRPSNKQIENLNILKNMRDAGTPVLSIIQGMLMSCSHPKITANNTLDFNETLLINESNKLAYIEEILMNIKEKNEKVIIFTKYKKMQRILSIVINKWFGYAPKVINGESNTSVRRNVLKEFQESKGFKIIILSPEAAGVGLNITEANHVIHYTRHWNPAKEEQATDRAYRIGQKKDVFVYYPIVSFNNSSEKVNELTFNNNDEWINAQINMDTSEGSPEEKLNKLILKKKKILKDFFFAASTEFTSKELEEDLFGYKDIKKDVFLKITDIDNIEWDLFEALSVLIIEKMFNGYGYLTNKGSDKGIDGLVFTPKDNILIQSKKSSSKTGRKAFNEIVGGQIQYEKVLNKKFNKLFIITNADIAKTLKELEDDKLIEVIERKKLAEFLNNNNIKLSELIEKNKDRYNIQSLKNLL